MDKQKILKLLGLEGAGDAQAFDKDAVKNAYRSLVVQVNPEDNPEGFKELRQAYEEALKLCEVTEPKVKEADTSPLGQWILKVEEVYENIKTRTDINIWRGLLREDICIDFDTSDAARDKLMTFFMGHFRLPGDVFRCADECFQILADKKELLEQFPEQFLDFLEFEINNEDFIVYSFFEGEECADYDSYISEYLAIKEKVDLKDTTGIEKLFEDIERFDIYHPFLEVEKLKLSIMEHAVNQELYEKLSFGYGQNTYVRCYLMLANWEMGKYDLAYEDITYLLERTPNHYLARKQLILYYMQQEEYKKSKEECEVLLNKYPADAEIRELLWKNSEVLIEFYQKEIEENRGNIELFIELGWCFFSNERTNELVELLDSFAPSGKYILDYHNLKGRNLVAMGRYEEALPSLLIWEEEITKLADDGSAAVHKRKRRYILARYLQAICYHEMFCGGKKDKDLLNQALERLDFDLRAGDDNYTRMAAYNIKARIYLDLGRNESCIELCEDMIVSEPGYFPAYVLIQEAYFNLHDGQKVVDYYHKAIELYTKYSKPYLLAAKAFYMNRQLEDAEEIVERVVAGFPEEKEGYQLKAKILWRQEKMKEASVLFEEYGENAGEDDDFFYGMGCCYFETGKTEKALKAFLEAVRINPEHPSAYNYIAIIYSRFYEEQKKESYLKDAVTAATHQINNRSNSYFLIERGLIYTDAALFSEAVDDFKEAALLEPDNVYAYNNMGYAYQLCKNEKEAAAMYGKAIELDSSLETILPFINIGNLYLIMQEYDKAYEAYKRCQKLFPDVDIYKKIGVLLRQAGKYEEAVRFYQGILAEADQKKESGRAEDILYFLSLTYQEKGDFKKAKGYYRELKKRNAKNIWAYLGLAGLYLFGKELLYKASAFLLKANQILILKECKDGGFSECLLLLAETAFLRGKKEAAANYAKQLLNQIGEPEEYIKYAGEKFSRCYTLCLIFYFSGNLDKAKRYAAMMDGSYRCKRCYYGQCIDSFMAKAYIAMAEGNNREAVRLLERVQKFNPNHLAAGFYLKRIEKKL